jgi:hypothetical protein
LERELAQIEGKRSKAQKFLLAILRESEAEVKEKAEGEEKAEGDREKAEGEEKAESEETFLSKTWRMVVAYANNCCICK